jgi:uncharacterized protein (DUF1330 family)/SAM-dependent methyltransferase
MSTSAYALAQLRIRDRARYDAYARRFHDTLNGYGGRLLVADEVPEVLEGSVAFEKVVLLEFPSRSALDAWSQSAAYQALAEERRASTDGVVVALRAFPQRPRYDAIGHGYARVRREDPRIRERIHKALGNARSVLNVGAGAGSYEPTDRQVLAVEPSAVMAQQRSVEAGPALRAYADNLPLHDGSVDAAMAVLSIHHWEPDQERGVRELRRVSRGPVAVLTIDPRISATMWLMAEYLPEVAKLDLRIFPFPERVAQWLGGDVRVDPVPVHRDTPDWMLLSYWAHPERVLDADARAATSGFARMPADVVARVATAVRRDLDDGTWERRHGHLRKLDENDVGLRLIVSPGNGHVDAVVRSRVRARRDRARCAATRPK